MPLRIAVAFAAAVLQGALARPRVGDAQPPPIDLASRRVRSTEVTVPANVAAADAHLADVHLFHNELIVAGLARPIALGRSMTARVGEEPASAFGLDPETVKVEWLAPEELLWITWSTVPLGQGAYRKQGAVLLQRSGDAYRELFRDSIYAFGSVGSGNSSSASLAASWDDAARTVTLTLIAESASTSTERGPLADGPDVADSGRRIYSATVKTGEVRRYAIRDGALQQLAGERFVDLAKPKPVRNVARALDVPVVDVVRLNPGLEPEGEARGVVRVADRLPAYAFENDDGICEQPCPEPTAAPDGHGGTS